MLENLSSSDVNLRLGAARGLSQYSDLAVPELISAASSEVSAMVMTNLEDTISLVNNRNQGKIFDANKRSVVNRAQALGYIKGIQDNDIVCHEVEGLEFLGNKQVRKYLNDTYEYGQICGELQKAKNRNASDRINEKTVQQYELISNENRVKIITSAVISRWIRQGKIKNLDSIVLDLSESNFYRATFPLINIDFLNLSLSLMRHSKLCGSIIKNSIFDNADMFGANLSNTTFILTSFKNTHLRKAKSNRVRFEKCEFNNAILSESDFSISDFRESTFENSKLRGTNLSKCDFFNTKFKKSELHGVNLSGSILDSSELFGSVLINANMNGVTAKKCRLNGVDLRGANLSNSILIDADLRGANLKNVNFGGADLRGANFQNVNLEGADFSDSDITDVDFRNSNIDNVIFFNVKGFDSAKMN
ncbi:pentapeptide repeat precursor [Vibrio ishigakensis]|uniref:Pentapeptide repeat n=1 Tax=Vibrio ishigakensis TaxID=1481914 RepID=A0A0B8P7H9_9VIBR|nr:pentapeptide repeat precursor [Vibrio ishigakensis]